MIAAGREEGAATADATFYFASAGLLQPETELVAES